MRLVEIKKIDLWYVKDRLFEGESKMMVNALFDQLVSIMINQYGQVDM